MFVYVFRIFRIRHPFLLKMLATDAKTQKIEPGLILFYFFMMDKKFGGQCVNVMDTT